MKYFKKNVQNENTQNIGTNESSGYRSTKRFYNMLLIKRIDGGILVTDILWVLMLFINQIL
jgi:hypothetical protein